MPSSKSVKHKYNTRYQARLERQKSSLSDDTSIGENSNKNKSNLCHNNNETNYLNKNSINIDNIDDIVVDEEEETKNNYNIHKRLANNQPKRSKPIPINVPASIAKRKIYFDDIAQFDTSMSEYIMIDTTKIENQSEPVKNISQKITDSFREYLNSSVTMLKHSYNYITNNKSI